MVAKHEGDETISGRISFQSCEQSVAALWTTVGSRIDECSIVNACTASGGGSRGWAGRAVKNPMRCGEEDAAVICLQCVAQQNESYPLSGWQLSLPRRTDSGVFEVGRADD